MLSVVQQKDPFLEKLWTNKRVTRVKFFGYNPALDPDFFTVEHYRKFCVDLYLKHGFHKNLWVVGFSIAGHICW